MARRYDRQQESLYFSQPERSGKSLAEYRDELSASLAARRELGRDAEDVLVSDFLRKIEQQIEHSIDARLGTKAGRQLQRRGGRQFAQIGIAAVSLVAAIPLSAIALHEAGSSGLETVFVTLFLINVINILRS